MLARAGFARSAFAGPDLIAGGGPLIAHIGTSGTASAGVTTPGIDTTGATLLLVTVGWTNTAPTLTDSKGNTWTPLTASAVTNPGARLFYCSSPIVGAGHTFSLGASANDFASLLVQAFSGFAVYDGTENGADAHLASSFSLATGSVAPSMAGCLIVTGLTLGDATALPLAIDSGWSITDALDDVGVFGGGMAYTVQTAAAAVNPTWHRANASTRSTARIAVFQPTSGGSPQSATPAAAISTWLAVAASVVLGGVVVSPAPATSTWSVVTPTITVGAAAASPAAAISTWTVVTPDISQGGAPQSRTTTAAIGTWSVVTPTITLAITVTPAVAISAWSTVSPSTSVGGVTVSPAPATRAWSVVTPTIPGTAPRSFHGTPSSGPQFTGAVSGVPRFGGTVSSSARFTGAITSTPT